MIWISEQINVMVLTRLCSFKQSEGQKVIHLIQDKAILKKYGEFKYFSFN